MISKVLTSIGPNIEVESIRLMGETGKIIAILELPSD